MVLLVNHVDDCVCVIIDHLPRMMRYTLFFAASLLVCVVSAQNEGDIDEVIAYLNTTIASSQVRRF